MLQLSWRKFLAENAILDGNPTIGMSPSIRKLVGQFLLYFARAVSCRSYVEHLHKLFASYCINIL